MFNIALLHEYKNEYGDAYALYKLILQFNPYFIEADIKLGELAKLRGNKDKAIEYMKSAIDKHFYQEKGEKLNTEEANNLAEADKKATNATNNGNLITQIRNNNRNK